MSRPSRTSSVYKTIGGRDSFNSLRSRLISDRVPEATADAWLAAWKAQAARDGLEHGSCLLGDRLAVDRRGARLQGVPAGSALQPGHDDRGHGDRDTHEAQDPRLSRLAVGSAALQLRQVVDLDGRTLCVSAQLDRQRELAEVKTESGRRTFGLPELALYALRTQKVKQAKERIAAGSDWQDEGYVFATTDGHPMHSRSLDAAFVQSQGRAGVRRQRFHDMRHAFATLLLDAGEEVAVISKMLGHADYSTTVDVYSHLSTARSRVAAARIDGLLKRREVAEIA
jgi:hypothetical protein